MQTAQKIVKEKPLVFLEEFGALDNGYFVYLTHIDTPIDV